MFKLWASTVNKQATIVPGRSIEINFIIKKLQSWKFEY